MCAAAAHFFIASFFVFAVDKIENNKHNNKKNNYAHNDPYPERNCKAGRRASVSDFELNEKNGRKSGNIYGSGSGCCGRKKIYFHNNVCGCLICKGRKSGSIFDDKAVYAVFFFKAYVGNRGTEIGFGSVKIGVFAIGHIIFAFVIADVGNMNHGKNIAVKAGFRIRLGAVKGIGYGSKGVSVIGKTICKKGKFERGKSVAGSDKISGGGIGCAVAVQCDYA